MKGFTEESLKKRNWNLCPTFRLSSVSHLGQSVAVWGRGCMRVECFGLRQKTTFGDTL